MIGIAVALAILLSALASPILIVWALYCLRVPIRRGEGLTILGCGALLASSLLIVSWLTTDPQAPGLLRLEAFISIAGFFGIGGAIGLLLWRRFRIVK